MVDPWGGFNEATNNLNNTLAQIPDQDARRALARQQLAMGNIQLQEAQRQQQMKQGLRNAVMTDAANATPDVTTTAENGGYTPTPQDYTSSSRALLGGAADTTPAKTRANEATFGVVSPTTAPTETPKDLNFTPAPAFNPVAEPMAQQAQQEAAPQTVTTTTKGQKANPLKAQVDYLNSIGEGEKAMALQATILDHANKVAALTGNPQDGLTILNQSTGMNLAYSPLPSLDAVTSDGQLVGYIDKNRYKELVTSGTPPLQAMDGALIKLDLGGGGKAVMEYMASHPNATPDELAGVGAKNGVSLSKMVPLLNETVKAQNEKAAMVRQQNQFAHAEEMQGRQFAHAEEMQRRSADIKLNVNPLSADETATLQKAVTEGRLDPSKINSRTGKVLAGVLKGNELDLNNAAATAGALKKVEAQRSMVSTFEKTASKNFDLVEQLYDKNPQGTVMLLNKLKNNINTKITGDPDTVMAGRAIQTALMEYAKVVTGQTGGAAVSDSARKEVESLLSLSDKPETFHGTIANHRKEMQNRMDSFQDTINELKGGRGENTRAGTGTITTKGGFKVTVVQ